MKPCTKYKETLFLEIHGELPPEKLAVWNEHLAACASCREERQRMANLLTQTKEAFPSPTLRPEEVKRIWGHVREAQDHGEAAWWRRKGAMRKLVPVALAAALVLVFAGGLKVREFRSLVPFGPEVKVSADLDELNQAADLEIIRNLELLEEMDSLKKLVQVVDQREMI
jgi:predicted anti-sigma-YlaC factor YlaD